MKTRNIIAILTALPVMAGVVSCKSDDELTAKPAKEILKVEGGGLVLPARQSEDVNSMVTANVSITADCGWTVMPYDGGDFGKDMSVQPEKGVGNGTLVVTVPRNMTVFERKDTITLMSDGGLRQRIPIRQSSSSGNMSISASKVEFDANGNGITLPSVIINSNLDWTIEIPSSSAGWLSLTDASGMQAITKGTSGSTTVHIHVTPNMTDATRSTFFDVKYKDEIARVEVTQTGISEIYLNAPETLNTFADIGGEQMLRVECNAEWHAYLPASVDWINLEPAQGVGNGEIRVMCTENNTTKERLSAIVIISGSKDPKQCIVVVNQVGNGSAVPLQTAVSLYELSVLRHSANFLFSIVSEEVVGDYGIVFSDIETTPTLNDSIRVFGRGGTSQGVSAEVKGLKENTTYYVRAFVRKPSNNNEPVYSNVLTIKTLASDASIGMLYSMSVGNTSAEFQYNFVSDEAVQDYGLVYSSTNSTPTVYDNVVTVGQGGTTRSVLAVLSDLQETTSYYVRAYIRTSQGYIYSNVVTITTSASAHEPGESDNPSPQLARRR